MANNSGGGIILNYWENSNLGFLGGGGRHKVKEKVKAKGEGKS